MIASSLGSTSPRPLTRYAAALICSYRCTNFNRQQWVGPDGETRGRNESVPSTELGELRDQAQSHASNLREAAQNEAQSTADRVSNVADQGQQSAGGVRADDGDRANAAANAGANQAGEEKDRLVNKLSSKIPQVHKDLAKEHYGKAKVSVLLL